MYLYWHFLCICIFVCLCVSLFVMMSIVLVEQEPESKVVPSVKGAASSICYGPVDRLFIVARYTNTHSLADTQLLLPPKHNPKPPFQESDVTVTC